MLNTEARTIDADVLSRRCVLMRLLDFSYEQYQKALRQSAGAVVIILPRAMAAVPQDVIRVSLHRHLPQRKERWVWSPLGGLGQVLHTPVPSALQEAGWCPSAFVIAPSHPGALGRVWAHVLMRIGELLASRGQGWERCSAPPAPRTPTE